jgi:hypothetical protein
MKNLEWFKDEVSHTLKEYTLNYKFFKEGDFGSLNQVEFNSKKIGGNIDFWEFGWLGIFVWDYETEEQLFNILLDSNQETEKEEAFNKLQELLQ